MAREARAKVRGCKSTRHVLADIQLGPALLPQAKPAKARAAAGRRQPLRRLPAFRPGQPLHRLAAPRRQEAVPRPSRRRLQRGLSLAALPPAAPLAVRAPLKRPPRAPKLAQLPRRQPCGTWPAVMVPCPAARSLAEPQSHRPPPLDLHPGLLHPRSPWQPPSHQSRQHLCSMRAHPLDRSPLRPRHQHDRRCSASQCSCV